MEWTTSELARKGEEETVSHLQGHLKAEPSIRVMIGFKQFPEFQMEFPTPIWNFNISGCYKTIPAFSQFYNVEAPF